MKNGASRWEWAPSFKIVGTPLYDQCSSIDTPRPVFTAITARALSVSVLYSVQVAGS